MTRHLQDTYTEWADREYPGATPLSIALEIQREAKKLVNGLAYHEGVNVEEECADILLLLFHLSSSCDFRVYHAASEKFNVLKVRGFHPSPRQVRDYQYEPELATAK